MKLVKLLVVFGIGYVVGTRAGRQRYDQIRDLATTVTEDPRVRDAAEKAQSVAREATEKVSEKVAEKSGASPGAHAADRPEDASGTWPEHPDTHVEVPDDEVVYSTGPQTR